MPHTKENKCKESVCELKDNVDLTESLNWSLLEKRIGDDLNTLEFVLNSGLSSSVSLESKDIFQTFEIKSSNIGHLNTPNISHLNLSTIE